MSWVLFALRLLLRKRMVLSSIHETSTGFHSPLISNTELTSKLEVKLPLKLLILRGLQVFILERKEMGHLLSQSISEGLQTIPISCIFSKTFTCNFQDTVHQVCYWEMHLQIVIHTSVLMNISETLNKAVRTTMLFPAPSLTKASSSPKVTRKLTTKLIWTRLQAFGMLFKQTTITGILDVGTGVRLLQKTSTKLGKTTWAWAHSDPMLCSSFQIWMGIQHIIPI